MSLLLLQRLNQPDLISRCEHAGYRILSVLPKEVPGNYLGMTSSLKLEEAASVGDLTSDANKRKYGTRV